MFLPLLLLLSSAARTGLTQLSSCTYMVPSLGSSSRFQQQLAPEQDALDAIDFISGPPGSRWGAERARMGRALPWHLSYVAVGNEAWPRPAQAGTALCILV